LKVVGDQLSTWAIAQKDKQKQDVFGRSAFNRYYYSAFLITRQMLGEFEDRWKSTAHREIPNLLRASVKRKVESRLKINVRTRIMTESEKSRFLMELKTSLNELAALLSEAYDVRIIADYEPEMLVTFEKKIISLRNYKLTSANNWPGRARAYCKTIRRVWKGCGLG